MTRVSGLLLAILLWAPACTMRSPLPNDYFSNLENVVGGEKPSAPQIINFDYPTNTTLEWTASVDPDSDPANQAVTTYFVYYYLNSVPDGNDKYNSEFVLFTVENATSISLQNLSFPSGTSYLGVSGFDGGRESEISNIVSFTQ